MVTSRLPCPIQIGVDEIHVSFENTDSTMPKAVADMDRTEVWEELEGVWGLVLPPDQNLQMLRSMLIEERAKAMAEKAGGGCKAFTSLEAALAEGDFDAVDLMLLHTDHEAAAVTDPRSNLTLHCQLAHRVCVKVVQHP